MTLSNVGDKAAECVYWKATAWDKTGLTTGTKDATAHNYPCTADHIVGTFALREPAVAPVAATC